MAPSLNQVCVAFQGGGALGMAHLGAWQILARRFSVIGTAGTSAGSIVAALCASGYTPAHTIDLFYELEWPEFVKPQSWLDLFHKRDGWSDGERFYQWMSARLATYLTNQSQPVTFTSLFQETGTYLAIVACDLNDRTAQRVLFDEVSEPETSVAFAVRASMSIPGLFVAVPRRDRGQILVDGGLLLNLPIEPLYPLAQRKSCPLISVRFQKPTAYLDSPNIRDVLTRALGIMMTPGNLPPAEIKQNPNYIDIAIDVSGFESLNFKLTLQEKQELVRRGAQAAAQALLEYDLRNARSNTEIAHSISSEQLKEQRDIYISRTWRQDESPLADHVCQLLDKAGFRMIGDAKDQLRWGEDRVKSIISNCGGLVAVVPDRGQGQTSKYIPLEIEIARALMLPCLIVAEPTVELTGYLNEDTMRMRANDIGSSFAEATLQKRIEMLKENWKELSPKDYIFVATNFDSPQRNTEIKQVIERVSALHCELGDEIRESPIQQVISERISHALLVIADLSGNSESEWNVNTSIEAGIAEGAKRELYLLCSNPRRSPPFMFRDKQVHFYNNEKDLLEIVYRIAFPYRRLILNYRYYPGQLE